MYSMQLVVPASAAAYCVASYWTQREATGTPDSTGLGGQQG